MQSCPGTSAHAPLTVKRHFGATEAALSHEPHLVTSIIRGRVHPIVSPGSQLFIWAFRRIASRTYHYGLCTGPHIAWQYRWSLPTERNFRTIWSRSVQANPSKRSPGQLLDLHIGLPETSCLTTLRSCKFCYLETWWCLLSGAGGSGTPLTTPANSERTAFSTLVTLLQHFKTLQMYQEEQISDGHSCT